MSHRRGGVFIHQCVYIASVTLIGVHSLTGTDEDSLCDVVLREVYRSVLGAVVWAVLTRVEASRLHTGIATSGTRGAHKGLQKVECGDQVHEETQVRVEEHLLFDIG